MRRCRLENRQTGWPTKSRKSGAEIFVGDRGLRAAYKILLKNAAKGNVLCYLYPFEGYRPVASLFYYLRMHLSQKQKEMDQRGIAALGFKKSEHYEKLPKDINMRFLPFPLPATMDTLRDRLIIISWANMTGILISSKEIADHFSDYFDNVWKIARR
jgi:HTH-type transcriptional regulator, sugar sensing transcriptional regulator